VKFSLQLYEAWRSKNGHWSWKGMKSRGKSYTEVQTECSFKHYENLK